MLAPMSTKSAFLSDVNAFLERHSMTATTFGLKAVNDVAFVHRLRKGSDTKLSTMDKVRAFMAAYDKKKRSKVSDSRLSA